MEITDLFSLDNRGCTYNVEEGPFFFLGADTGCSGGASGIFSTGLVTIFTSKYTPYTLSIKPISSKINCIANGKLISIDMRMIIEPLPHVKAALVNEPKEVNLLITCAFYNKYATILGHGHIKRTTTSILHHQTTKKRLRNVSETFLQV
ncbi:hypothetical protein ACIQXI_21440 [Lysinibacillus sp. NPDC097195]|uniref:hypothetical protein n=1 Tax=Lysinibacillus sp. NPDC097195 TaxID=3364141 RepID=UPI00380B6532